MNKRRKYFDPDLLINEITKKCRIQGEPIYINKGTFEFIVNRFCRMKSSVRMGVRITDRGEKLLKKREFPGKSQNESIVDLCAYVVIHHDVDVNDCVPELIYNALVTYAFQKGMREESIKGIRITSDSCYEFFDIEKAADAFGVDLKDRQDSR